MLHYIAGVDGTGCTRLQAIRQLARTVCMAGIHRVAVSVLHIGCSCRALHKRAATRALPHSNGIVFCRCIHRGQCQGCRGTPGLCDGLHLSGPCQVVLGAIVSRSAGSRPHAECSCCHTVCLHTKEGIGRPAQAPHLLCCPQQPACRPQQASTASPER